MFSSTCGRAGRLFQPLGVHRFNTDSPKMASFTFGFPIWHSTLRLEYSSRTLAIGLSPILFISNEGSSPNLRLVVAITHTVLMYPIVNRHLGRRWMLIDSWKVASPDQLHCQMESPGGSLVQYNQGAITYPELHYIDIAVREGCFPFILQSLNSSCHHVICLHFFSRTYYCLLGVHMHDCFIDI